MRLQSGRGAVNGMSQACPERVGVEVSAESYQARDGRVRPSWEDGMH